MTSPDSVVFSLRSLRAIEEQRIQREEDEAREQAEAQRRAQEAARAAALDAEQEARRRAAEAEERARAREAERAREERLRLAEAATRARIEAELQLERERVAREHEARRADRRPTLVRLLPIALCVPLLVTSVLSFMAWRREGANASALAAQLEGSRRREADARRWKRGLEAALADKNHRIASLHRDLAHCRTRRSPLPSPAPAPSPASPPGRPSTARPAGKPPRPPTIDTSCAKDPIGCIAPGR